MLLETEGEPDDSRVPSSSLGASLILILFIYFAFTRLTRGRPRLIDLVRVFALFVLFAGTTLRLVRA